MTEKILIVGGVAGGASAAARLRRLDENLEIVMFEKGPHISFSNCCLPYYLSRTVPESEQLVVMQPEEMHKKFNVDVRTKNEVLSIDRKKKEVSVKNHLTGEIYTESYDKLILSPGGNPIMPRSIEGIDGDNVFSVRNVGDIRKLDAYVTKGDVKDIAIVGGGFIGCEVAENLREAGFNVHLIEAGGQIMGPFDFDLVQILHKQMLDHGVDLILEDGIKAIAKDSVELASGRKVKAEAVVMAIGIIPDTKLAKEAGLEIGVTGAIKTGKYYQTSDEDIYAVGDAVELTSAITHKPMRLALAWPAQMAARSAADHICGRRHRNKGVIGSSVIRIFDMYAASTGLNEKTAKAEGINYEAVYVVGYDKVKLMPDCKPIHLKVLYEAQTGKVLGAQAVSANNPDRRIDVIATVISLGGTMSDLADLELCYAPVVANAKDAVNIAGLIAENLMNGLFKQVPMTKLEELVEEGAYILDVRGEDMYKNDGHVEGTVNIPWPQLRNRLDEIPKDRPIYVHCMISLSGYNCCRILAQHGFKEVYNITGSFLAFCYYEYAQEVLYGKKRILTNYIFR